MSGLFLLPVLAVGLVVLAGPALVLWLLVLVVQLRRRVRDLQGRVAALERGPAGGPVAAAAPPPPGTSRPAPAAEPGAWPVAPAPPAAPRHDDVAPGAAVGGEGVGRLEGRLGSTWLNRAGVVLLLLGGGFFLKYAFESDWLGPAGRVGLGLAAGLALLVLGLALQGPTYRAPAQGLVAAGLGLWYLSGYAAHAMYGLVGLGPAFAFMVLVTAVGLGVALRHDARALAFLANLGAFLTPVLLEPEGGADPEWLFPYLVLVSVGILAVAVRRRWPELTVLSFVGTQFLYWDWLLPWTAEPGRLRPAVVGATGFFVVFALAGFAQARHWPDGAPAARRRLGGLLVLAPATAYFLALREILEPDRPAALALVCLGLAAGYLAAGRALQVTAERTTPPAVLHLAAGLAFLTLALGVWLDTPTLVLAWAAEAVALLAGGLRTGSQGLRAGGLAVLGLAGLRWWSLLAERSGGRFLVDHPALPPTVALGAAAVIGAVLYGRHPVQGDPSPAAAGEPGEKVLSRREGLVRPLLILLAVGSLATFLTMELRALAPFAVPGPVAEAGVLVTWTLAALPLLALARGDRTRLLLVAVSLLLATLALRTMADAEDWRAVAPPLRPAILNVRFLAGLLMVVAAGLYARVVPEFPHLAARTGARLGALGGGVAAVLLLWNLSAEVLLWPLPGRPAPHADKVRSAGLSILWALYAFAAMGVGMWRRSPGLRLGAIALFGLAVAKVLVVDLSALDAIYRILSFLVLGAVLLVASFLYARYRRDVRDLPPPPNPLPG